MLTAISLKRFTMQCNKLLITLVPIHLLNGNLKVFPDNTAALGESTKSRFQSTRAKLSYFFSKGKEGSVCVALLCSTIYLDKQFVCAFPSSRAPNENPGKKQTLRILLHSHFRAEVCDFCKARVRVRVDSRIIDSEFREKVS